MAWAELPPRLACSRTLSPLPTSACCIRPGSPSIAFVRTPRRSSQTKKEGHRGRLVVNGATWNSPQMALFSHSTISFDRALEEGTIDYVGSAGYKSLFLRVAAAYCPPKLGFS